MKMLGGHGFWSGKWQPQVSPQKMITGLLSPHTVTESSARVIEVGSSWPHLITHDNSSGSPAYLAPSVFAVLLEKSLVVWDASPSCLVSSLPDSDPWGQMWTLPRKALYEMQMPWGLNGGREVAGLWRYRRMALRAVTYILVCIKTQVVFWMEQECKQGALEN